MSSVVKLDTLQHAASSAQAEVVSNIANKMRASAGGTGGKGQLRNAILFLVTEERYEKAITDLRTALDSKPEYPQFKERSEKFAGYSVELINAIQAKRNFPGFGALHISKQKELFERALLHFEDLKATLEKIETIESEERMDDMRATVWVIRAFTYSIFTLLLFAVVRELTNGVVPTVNVLVDSTTSNLVDFVFDKFKL